jgi:ABC-type transport system involved in cytochrome c biogenesis permease subunit
MYLNGTSAFEPLSYVGEKEKGGLVPLLFCIFCRSHISVSSTISTLTPVILVVIVGKTLFTRGTTRSARSQVFGAVSVLTMEAALKLRTFLLELIMDGPAGHLVHSFQ